MQVSSKRHRGNIPPISPDRPVPAAHGLTGARVLSWPRPMQLAHTSTYLSLGELQTSQIYHQITFQRFRPVFRAVHPQAKEFQLVNNLFLAISFPSPFNPPLAPPIKIRVKKCQLTLSHVLTGDDERFGSGSRRDRRLQWGCRAPPPRGAPAAAGLRGWGSGSGQPGGTSWKPGRALEHGHSQIEPGRDRLFTPPM